jgi:peptidoglycan/xylan/chitin deacetylase (PgdA/CDA1 family)
MRSFFACVLLASLIGIGTARAEECPQGALGVSRTIAVDPSEHARLGSFQYGESLPLNDHEVVLTFDDGPLPPYTGRILEALAAECVKATFFMVGRQVRGYPALVRRVYNEGHTVANHSQNHPFTFQKMTVDQASKEIEDGFASLESVLGDPQAVAPFFRIPGLLRQDSVEQYLAAHGYMTWSVDFLADDWKHIKSKEIVQRAIDRIEARGRGILLLHDIHPATALALPEILQELKARGFKIVHVVPATAGRPKTVTAPEQWVVRHSREEQPWPRTLVVGLETPEPELAAPSPSNFGIETFGGRTRIALAHTFERRVVREGEPAGAVTVWPQVQAYAIAAERIVLPAPAAHNFRYAGPLAAAAPGRPKLAWKRSPPSSSTKPKKAHTTGSRLSLLSRGRTRPVGHQLTVGPPTNILPVTQ